MSASQALLTISAIVRIAQVTVIVDPLRQDRAFRIWRPRPRCDVRARGSAELQALASLRAAMTTRAPIASMMLRAFSTSCALLA